MTFLDALPVLHAGNLPFVTATCLRNPPRFRSAAHFNNEYIALSSPADLEKTFHVREETHVPDPTDMMPMAEYRRWYPCHRSKSLAERMSRLDLETWLYRIFLKLSVPKERTIRSMTLIYSPLNLTVFVRLCDHLHKIGYPAHWLNGVLGGIMSGEVTTKARPPRSEPLKIKETKADMPPLAQSTRPFVAELSTLLSIWSPVLSFGLQSSALPALDAVHKNLFTLETVPDDPVAEPPAFVLVFLDDEIPMAGSSDKGLRPYLLSDELGETTHEAKALRDRGIHVLTTWTWDRRDKSAAFWLRQDVMEAMRKAQWLFTIWRTDNWRPQSDAFPISMIQDAGPFMS